jgi:transcriptional regulator with XRE-family HTH domain
LQSVTDYYGSTDAGENVASDSGKILSSSDSLVAAGLLREEIARQRLSRQFVADTARISLSTLEKALAGNRPFTIATVVRLETALGVPLRQEVFNSAIGSSAPLELGGYAHASVSWFEGTYLTLRPSFSDPRAIYAYETTIEWDATASCLTFSETRRTDTDYAQKGRVSAPHQSGHVYLVTNDNGQFRLITLSRPARDGSMFGILSSLVVGTGSNLTPVATPIAFIPRAKFPQPEYGKITGKNSSFGSYRKFLDQAIEDRFAVLIVP